MPGVRMRRVNEAVKEVISVHIAEYLQDPRIGFVTLTSVDTSADLAQARVYVTVLGGDEERQQALAGLRSARAVLQAEIGRQLHLKRTPTLEFVYDHTTDQGMRIGELLDEALPHGDPSEEGR